MNWEQLKTILWLRWRLTRNQWTRSKGLGAIITGLVALSMVVLAGLSFVGGFLGGMLGLRDAKPVLIMAVWLGVTLAFLFIWVIGLVNELQRSETIDLQRLMHLPVALGQIFLINYLASHLTMGIALFVPGMLGLTAGLVISRGASMVFLVPLALSMVFMVSAWTYLLRGWLATLMSNPRRRRTVIMGITFTFLMVSQTPNLYFNVLARKERHPSAATPDQPNARRLSKEDKERLLLIAETYIPPLWLPLGANALAEARVLPALLGTMGCLALGALGLQRAYRSTVRFYHGETGKQAPDKGVPEVAVERSATTGARPTKTFVERRIPGVPEQAAAVALASFRSMLRAPEVKMSWASSFFVTLILGASFLLRSPPKLPEALKPFMATGAVAFPIFMLVQFFSNQFGFDRDGFRALVLSPASRREILLGKNLACLPAGAGLSLFVLALVAVWAGLSPFTVLASVCQLLTLLIMAALAGNLLSIVAPYRIQPGSMKPTKMPGLAMLLMAFCHLLFPVTMLPGFLPPLAEFLWRQAGGTPTLPVNLLLSAAVAGILCLVYWQTLEPIGRLLQRRETKILQVVSVEVE